MYPILFAWKLSKFSKKFRTHTACLMSQSKMFGNFSSLQQIFDFCVLFCFVFKSSEKGTNLLFFWKVIMKFSLSLWKRKISIPAFSQNFEDATWRSPWNSCISVLRGIDLEYETGQQNLSKAGCGGLSPTSSQARTHTVACLLPPLFPTAALGREWKGQNRENSWGEMKSFGLVSEQ